MKYISVKNYFCALPKIFAAIFLGCVCAGCSSVEFKAGDISVPPKPPTFPITVYTPEMHIPRPYAVIGTVSIRAGKFTMFGGSTDVELAKLLRTAHEKGADAVKLADWKEPDFANPNYRISAELLFYTDPWETATMSKTQLQNYLASEKNSDPIEGIWFSPGLDNMTPHTIGIVKDNSKPGRNFIGFILDTQNPAWHAGMKKMDIARGLAPGSYTLTYYLDDFSHRDVSIILGNRRTFTFDLSKDDEDNFITYKKN